MNDFSEQVVTTKAALRHLARAAALEALYQRNQDEGRSSGPLERDRARLTVGMSAVGIDDRNRRRTDRFVDEFLGDGPCPRCLKG